MTSTEMNPLLSDAVRAELCALGTKHSRLQRQQRRARALAVGIGLVVVAGLTTGAAIVVNSLPGTATATAISSISSATHTGTGTMELGPVPARASAVIVTLACLNQVGTVSVETNSQSGNVEHDAEALLCGAGRTKPARIADAALPARGSTGITITAGPGTKWSATAQYASTSTTPWGVNARGHTYGKCTTRGCPDLIAAQVVDGEEGYVSDRQWAAFRGTGYIPVYKSDGTTVIGRFAIGIEDGK